MIGQITTPLAGKAGIVAGAAPGIGRALTGGPSRASCPAAIVSANADGLRNAEAMLTPPALKRHLDARYRLGQFASASEVAEWVPQPIGVVLNTAGPAGWLTSKERA